jgi:hypothetical protein
MDGWEALTMGAVDWAVNWGLLVAAEIGGDRSGG